MAKIDSNFKWLTYEEMAKNVAERVLDNFLYDGKSIREWIQIIGSEDAVSRQSAIVALDDRMSSLENVDMQIAMGFAKGIIHELPPVTPIPKMGRWTDDKCSVCGKGIEDLIDSPEWYRNEEPNFCPFCGIKMEKKSEG